MPLFYHIKALLWNNNRWKAKAFTNKLPPVVFYGSREQAEEMAHAAYLVAGDAERYPEKGIGTTGLRKIS